MPAIFDDFEIHFRYPENWTVDETKVEGQRSVTVYSPGGAFWSVIVDRPEVDPKELARTALAALTDEYDDLESVPVVEMIGERETSGFDINFIYLDLTSTALIRGFRTTKVSCLVLCQAEDREFAELAEVFRAMTTSLARESL